MNRATTLRIAIFGKFRRVGSLFCSVTLLLWPAAAWAEKIPTAADEAIEQRLAEVDRYLSSDELEGRGLGAPGLDLAADYVAKKFREVGLRTDLFGGTPFQTFRVTTEIAIGSDNRLALVGPVDRPGEPPLRLTLALNRDFTPTVDSGPGHFDLPLVFVGYGITAKRERYDDYAGVKVAGKAVVLLRHEPQQADPESIFNGIQGSDYSFLRRKISTAYDHGAAVVVVCNDLFDVRNHQRGHDPLLHYRPGPIGHVPYDIPVLHVHRAAMDRVVRAALGVDLAELEREINVGPTPHSAELKGWRIAGKIDIRRSEHEVKNVIGVLPGSGPTADETIIVGAHYDHLGCTLLGDPRHPEKAIYHGADDNASGVATIIEVARALAIRRGDAATPLASIWPHGRLHRRLVFIAFTGEETGHLGSEYYVAHPLFPLARTPAMLNLDMVGRLRDDVLIVKGAATASDFARLLAETNRQFGFHLTEPPGGYTPTDQAVFYARGIPAIDFFTGKHPDYHEPTDTFDKLNIPGMRRVEEFIEDVTAALADGRRGPTYVSLPLSLGDDRSYFGSIPDIDGSRDGYELAGVAKGSPADRAGFRRGDLIVQFGGSKIAGAVDFDAALRRYHGGERIRVVARRGAKAVNLDVTLAPQR